jgi:hypothetical protein
MAATRNGDYLSMFVRSLNERLNFTSGRRLLDAIDPRRIPASMNIIYKRARGRIERGWREQWRSRDNFQEISPL